MGELRVMRADAFEGTDAGSSGADRIGAAPIEGIEAATVQEALAAIAGRAAPGPATSQTRGIVLLSEPPEDPANPVAVETSDGRLSDARDPNAHAASHAEGGSDEISPAGIGAAAEDDPRLREISEDGTAVADRPVLDFAGDGVIVSDDAAGGRTRVNISGVAAGAASEAAAGVAEFADAAQIRGALDDAFHRGLAVSAFRLRQELDRRAPSVAEFSHSVFRAVPDAAWTDLAFDTAAADPAGWRSQPAPGLFTLPAGIYAVFFQASFAVNIVGRRGFRLLLNGAGRHADLFQPVGGEQTERGKTWLLRLAQQTTLGVQAFQNTGGNLNVAAAATLVIERRA